MAEKHSLLTRVGGQHFRSETEARWSLYFKSRGIVNHYEPRRFEIDGVRYVPDFYLDEFDLYVEVKPTEVRHGDEADKKGRLLAQASGRPVLLLVGRPRCSISGRPIQQCLHWHPEAGLRYPWLHVHELLGISEEDHWAAVQRASGECIGDGPMSAREIMPEVQTLVSVTAMLGRDPTSDEDASIAMWSDRLGHESVQQIARRNRNWGSFAKECWDTAAPVEVLR